jgi:hypothetical protein
MSAKTLAELALKLWGQASFMRASQAGYVLSVIGPALAGIVVMVWADAIVALFESDSTPLQIDVSSTQLQVLAFAIVGVFILVDGLQNAAAAGYVLFTKPEPSDL